MSQANKKHISVNVDYYRYSGLEFLYRFTFAANAYLTVFLQGRGMSASQVGLISAICSTMAILAAPVWGVVSDKLRSVRKAFLVLVAMGGLLWSLIPPSFGVALLGLNLGFIVIPLASFFTQPTNSLIDSWVVQSANRRRLNYGAVRIWGSIGYAVMTVSLGALLPRIGVDSTFYALGLWAIPLFILCFVTPDDAAARKPLSLREMHVGRLFRNYYFVTYLVFSFLQQIPVSTVLTFLPYLMKETQVSVDLFGAVTGYRALLEIPFLLLMARLRKRISLPKILLGASLLYLVECFSYHFISGMWLLFLMQTVHGMAMGLKIGSASNYVYRLAPDDLKATAQTLNGSVNALASILGSLLGGYLLDALGVRQYYLLAAGMILVSALFFFGSLYLGKRRRSEPSPLDTLSA